MNHPSYLALMRTPDDHADFLTEIALLATKLNDAGALSLHMSSRLTVDGKAFSQVKYLRTLEDHSSAWDVENIRSETIDRIVRHSGTIKSVDSGFDLPHFTDAFHLYVADMRERGVPVPKQLETKERLKL